LTIERLFDPWVILVPVDFQTSLFADEAAAAPGLAPQRRPLTDGAWVDVQRNWLRDPDDVFASLVERVPWRAERREMYDAVVDVPRLVHTYLADDTLPHPALVAGRAEDTMVAIVSVGDPRRLLLRPRGGGPSIALTMGHGDLVVMGGSCQRTWEHAVPKVAHSGPRISVQFRPANVF